MRGNAALALVVALAISAGAGVGVYFVIRNYRVEHAGAANVEQTPEPPPRYRMQPAQPVPVEPDVPTPPDVEPAPPAPPPTEITGGLDRGTIERVMRKRVPSAQKCFDAALQAHPELADGGTLRVQFTINADGSATGVSADGLDAAVANCVAGVVRRTQFPEPADGEPARAAYAFVFRGR